MAEREREATGQQPSAAELLRAALEKIVFFEWRVSELTGEVAAAHRRSAAAEKARAEAEEEARAASAQARRARLQCADLEAEQARAAELLAAPVQGRAAADAQALEEERARCLSLQEQLEQARAEVARARAERERWLTQMIGQAQGGDEAPAALAQFISELRGEVIALRDHQKRCESLLEAAGIAVPEFEPAHPPPQPPSPSTTPVQEARRMWAEGRLAAPPQAGAAPPDPVPAPAPRASGFALAADPGLSAAARALADQCLRGLASADSSRREQAARHLAAAPVAAASPAIATALQSETDVRARAQLAKALAACGGEGAAGIVERLQAEAETPLVRLAALDALCAIPSRARPAIEMAANDRAPAIRRRAAALAVAERIEDLEARFAADEDATVRGAVSAARSEAAATGAVRPEQPQAPAAVPALAEPGPPPPQSGAAPARRVDPVRAALQRLVLEGGSR